MDTLTRIDLILALASGVAFFAFCYFASPRKSVPVLLCLIPFQPISTPNGTLNVLLVYVMAIAFVLRGRIRWLPLGGFVLLILGAYVVSTGFAHPATRVAHAVYVFNLASAFLLFYLVYNFVRAEGDVRHILGTLVAMNVLVLIYCAAQTLVGEVSLFGVRELTTMGLRADGRLLGPFNAVGLTAEFFVLSTLLMCYLVVYAQGRWARLGLYALIGLNLLFLIATANRGGFLVLIGAGGWFLLLFRSQLGTARAVGLGLAGIMLLSIASLVIINFTDFPGLFERLEATEIDESGIPDTRVKTWTGIAPLIEQHPIIGHGPHFYQLDEPAPYPGFEHPFWPHNLYLYLLYTVGTVGLFAWLVFFASLGYRILKGLRAPGLGSGPDDLPRGLVKLGAIMIPIILIDQLKIEFLRSQLIDYWHYLFVLFGIWIALADNLRTRSREAGRELNAPAAQPSLVHDFHHASGAIQPGPVV
jgi:O-antigen ligase